MHMRLAAIISLAELSVHQSGLASTAATSAPNIVLILADDFGVGDIGDDEARILMVVAKSSATKSSEHFDWWRVPGAAAPTRSSKSKTSQGE